MWIPIARHGVPRLPPPEKWTKAHDFLDPPLPDKTNYLRMSSYDQRYFARTGKVSEV